MTSEEQPLNTKEEIKKIENEEVKVKKKTLKEKLRLIKENITVEPVLACYVIPGALTRLATQNLNLDKACRVNKNFGDTVCNALIAREGNKYQKEELVVQELIASMESWKSVLLTVIPSILILFIGAWSDRTGKRKICIVFPIIGDLITCLSNILNVYFFYELPVEVTMFLEGLFGSIFGGWITTYMGIFSYISDASSEESRTFRVGIANLCLTAGGPIGSVLSGVLLNLIGYYGVFTISSLLYLFCILYGIYLIEDPKKKKSEANEVKYASDSFWKNGSFKTPYKLLTEPVVLVRSETNNVTDYIYSS